MKNIAIALFAIAEELKGLGFRDSTGSHPRGFEAISIELKDGLSEIANAISDSSGGND